MSSPKPRVLCVDDEQHVLSGVKLGLRKHFEVTTALSGTEALHALASQGPFEVVLSDMRMPQMSGAELLAHARQGWPDVTRVLLTGHSEFEAAVAAVNEGAVFRFLTKPCPRDVLVATLGEASRHHRLVTAERVLLQETLLGCVRAMSETLALTNPVAFGRGQRIAHLARSLSTRLGHADPWAVEAAALLSQLGYAAVPAAVQEKAYRNETLDDQERAMLTGTAKLTHQILSRIPRIETVVGILEDSGSPQAADPRGQALRLARDVDTLTLQGLSATEAELLLRQREAAQHPPELLDALHRLLHAEAAEITIREVDPFELEEGMVLRQDVLLADGGLLVPRGFVVSAGFIARLQNFATRLAAPKLTVSVARSVLERQAS